MASRRGGAVATALISAALALALALLAGCGGSSSAGTTPADAAGPGRRVTAGGDSVAPDKGSHAIEEPAQSRGIKGESPATEGATSLRISAADCANLAAAAERRLGRSLRHDPKPTPPLSSCRISGRGVSVNLSLDSGFAAHQRYMNRMVEAVQFGVPDAGRVPHPVAGVGEKGAYNEYANWIPAFGTLYAVRGNRWITISFAATGEGGRRSREEAADLGRLAFRLTAH